MRGSLFRPIALHVVAVAVGLAAGCGGAPVPPPPTVNVATPASASTADPVEARAPVARASSAPSGKPKEECDVLERTVANYLRATRDLDVDSGPDLRELAGRLGVALRAAPELPLKDQDLLDVSVVYVSLADDMATACAARAEALQAADAARAREALDAIRRATEEESALVEHVERLCRGAPAVGR